MPLILQSRIFRSDLKANPNVTYVFGDNEGRYGLGGQAKEMRGEPNAVGVATLKAPGSFWSDGDAARQCAVLDADFGPILRSLADGKSVVFPLDGVGTGLADLPNRSPATFAHLLQLVGRAKGFAP